MKTFFSSLLLTILFFSGTSWGGQFVAPAMTSKVLNFRDLQGEKIEVSVYVTCRYNFQGGSCGVEHAETTLNTRGEFNLPKMKVAHSSWLRLNFGASVIFKIGSLSFTREFSSEKEYVAFLRKGVFVLFNRNLSFHLVPKNGEPFSKWYSSQVQNGNEYLVVGFDTYDKRGLLSGVYSAQINGSSDLVQIERALFQVLSFEEPLSYSIRVFKPSFVGSDGSKTFLSLRASVDPRKISDFTLELP